MKPYILFFVAFTALASCDVRRRDRISDDVGVKEEKTERASVIIKEKAEKDSLDKLAVFLKDKETAIKTALLDNDLTDVTHPFFKINELQFSEFATAIDSS